MRVIAFTPPPATPRLPHWARKELFRTFQVPPLKQCGVALYARCLERGAIRIRKIPSVLEVYVRGGTLYDVHPALSDIDLVILSGAQSLAEKRQTLQRIAELTLEFRHGASVIHDVSVLFRDELDEIQKYASALPCFQFFQHPYRLGSVNRFDPMSVEPSFLLPALLDNFQIGFLSLGRSWDSLSFAHCAKTWRRVLMDLSSRPEKHRDLQNRPLRATTEALGSLMYDCIAELEKVIPEGISPRTYPLNPSHLVVNRSMRDRFLEGLIRNYGDGWEADTEFPFYILWGRPFSELTEEHCRRYLEGLVRSGEGVKFPIFFPLFSRKLADYWLANNLPGNMQNWFLVGGPPCPLPNLGDSADHLAAIQLFHTTDISAQFAESTRDLFQGVLRRLLGSGANGIFFPISNSLRRVIEVRLLLLEKNYAEVMR